MTSDPEQDMALLAERYGSPQEAISHSLALAADNIRREQNAADTSEETEEVSVPDEDTPAEAAPPFEVVVVYEYSEVKDPSGAVAYVVGHSGWLRICLSVEGYFFAVAMHPIRQVHDNDGKPINLYTPMPLNKAVELAKTYGLQAVDNDPELTDYEDQLPNSYFNVVAAFKEALRVRYMPKRPNDSGHYDQVAQREAGQKLLEAVQQRRLAFAGELKD